MNEPSSAFGEELRGRLARVARRTSPLAEEGHKGEIGRVSLDLPADVSLVKWLADGERRQLCTVGLRVDEAPHAGVRKE